MPALALASGARLSYGAAGAGRTLIFVHGSPADGRAWARVIKHLPANLRILTPDLPGYGASDPLPAETTARTAGMGEAIGELIESCERPVFLCGHSYGGNVALHAAIRHRQRIESLVLLEPVFMRALDLAGRRQERVDAQAHFTSYLVRAAFAEPDAIALMVDFWFGEGSFARLPAPVKNFLNEATAKNAVDVEAAFAETVLAGDLATFRRPVALVHGTASAPLSHTIAHALLALLPTAKVVALVGANHGMLDSHPREVADLILGACRDSANAGLATTAAERI